MGFYLHGASFTHKTNLFDQVRDPKTMARRRPDKGLDLGFTTEGSYEEAGGTVAHIKAAMAYRKGVIAAEQYHGRINAEKFSTVICEQFPSMFKKSANPR